jgi:CubicO group peptidase (beta-lactamase class C family)
LAATSARIRSKLFGDFSGCGYQWWVDSSGIYSAIGRGGQLITVAPDKNMVVVLTAGLASTRDRKKEFELLKSMVLPAAGKNGHATIRRTR